MLLTKEQINKKYKNKYIEVQKIKHFDLPIYMYEVKKVYKQIHENTTLGQDLGTLLEYTR